MAKPCNHAPTQFDMPVAPWPVDGCAECVESNHRDWFHLRVCLACGHVGCCNDSPGKHATAHAEVSQHSLIRSYEPGEDWWYCYIDEVAFNLPGSPPAPSYE